MSPAQSKKMVVWTMFGTGALVIANKASSGGWPEPRLFLGLAVVYVILGFVSDVAPQLAGPLSLLVFIAILLAHGIGAFEGAAALPDRPAQIRPKRGRPSPGQPTYREVQGRKS